MSTKKAPNNKIVKADFNKKESEDHKWDIASENTSLLSKLKHQRIVIKCGNNMLSNTEAMYSMAKDIAMLQCHGAEIIVVHGSGDYVKNMIKIMGKKERLVDGEMIIDEPIFSIIEMVFKGAIAPRIVSDINYLGGDSVGLSGRDSNFLIADRMRKITKDPGSDIEKILDMGLMGEPLELDTDFLEDILDTRNVPVISPIGISHKGRAYVVSSDVLAGYIAEKMKADLLVYMTDFEGIEDSSGKLVNRFSTKNLKNLLTNNAIDPELAVKANSGIKAVENGVTSCSIIDGNKNHALLKDITREHGFGTVICNSKDRKLLPFD